MFLDNWRATPNSVGLATTSKDRYALRAAAERAKDVVTIADIEDAEGPVHAAAAELAIRQAKKSQKQTVITNASRTVPHRPLR
jgi:hypothetical protein